MRKTTLTPAAMHAGPNMTPLVDVVMVILIFLMLAGSFGINETALQTDISIDAGARVSGPPADPLTSLPPRIDVHVHCAADGFDVMQIGGETVRSSDELTVRLKARHAMYAANGSAEKAEIVIRPTANTAWEPVIAAYDAVLRADFRKVTLAMTK